MKRIREVFESIAYKGLKPSGGPAAPKKIPNSPGTLQGHVERFLAGGQPNDPLYLSNRTTAQKAKAWILIGVPCLILAAAIATSLYLLDPPEPKPLNQPSASEIAAKTLPNIPRDMKLAPSSDLELVEISVSNSRVSGVVQNIGKREIAAAELVFDLNDSGGSQLGAVSITVEKIPAAGRRNFNAIIKQRNATSALIREISVR
jgi:hypothetical protein